MTLPRPHMPLSVKLAAAILQLGHELADVEFDHCPALVLRKRTTDGGYDPPANDPRYIRIVSKAEHKAKTSGRKGEKRVTSYGSDAHATAKLRRLSRKYEEFKRLLLAKDCAPKARSRWPKRSFPKRRKVNPQRGERA